MRKTEYISSEFNRFGTGADRQETKVGYSIKKKFENENLYRDRASQLEAINKTFDEVSFLSFAKDIIFTTFIRSLSHFQETEITWKVETRATFGEMESIIIIPYARRGANVSKETWPLGSGV